IFANFNPAGAAGDAELAVSGDSLSEGDLGTRSLSFLITRTHNTDLVTVTATTQDASATAGFDYEPLTQTIVFTAGGSLASTIQISVTGDMLVEPDEAFSLILSAPISATLAVTNAVGTIINDDETFVSIAAGSVSEAAGSLPYTVTLSNAVSQPITVAVSSADGSAQVGDSDYQPIFASELMFPAETLTATGKILLTDDAVVEPDETLILTLATPISATLAVTDAVGTVLNDDVAIVSIEAGLGRESAGTLPYTLTLSAASSRPITVSVNTEDGSALVSDSDYQQITKHQILFPAGALTHTGQITVTDDAKVESDETFALSIGNLIANGLAISVSKKISDVAIIENDDSAAVTLVAPEAGFEGNSSLTPFAFTALLDHPVDGGFEVAYQTDSGTADTLLDLVDNDGFLTFAGTAGEEQQIIVNVRGDLAVEPTEAFSVTLGAVSKTSLSNLISVMTDSAIGTIIDDDSAGIFISNGRIVETDLGNNPQLVFTVTLSTEIVGGFSVDYSTADGSATASTGDYQPISGTLNFAGTAFESRPITVTVYGDRIVEADELLAVNLFNISSNDVAAFNSQGAGTIVNDDMAVLTLSEAISVTEGDTEEITVPVTVTLSQPVQGGFRLLWSAADKAATLADSDYLLAENQLVFDGDAGEQKTFKLIVQGDSKVELDESFSVQLDRTASLIGVDPAAILLPEDGRSITILNDDSATIILTGESRLEGTNLGFTTFFVTATLSADVDVPITVGFESAGETAQAGLDFTSTGGSKIFTGGAGETQLFEIQVVADEDIEPNESFTVQGSLLQSEGRDVSLPDDQSVATVTILDDDLKRVYLPLQYRDWRLVDGPDLVVSDIEIGSDRITVTIKNQGTEPVTRPFWVDSYLNPPIVPTGVNQTIIETQSEGFVWGIDLDSNAQTARLPMLPGDEIALTVGGQFYKASNSNFTSGDIPAGSTIYVQVDSFNPNTGFGQVEENHEIAGFFYNNIFKIVVSE
ncbi:MAG: Calx-beta domain-containing protein, partial [Anaerolineae bacterium]